MFGAASQAEWNGIDALTTCTKVKMTITCAAMAV
jgi:hypothetical protein